MIAVGSHLTKTLFCLFICSGNTYPLVIVAHPNDPTDQIAIGLSDGGVHVIEPKEKSDNGAATHPYDSNQIAVGLSDGGVHVIEPKEKSNNGAASSNHKDLESPSK